jgi:hypothetical protein
LFATPGQFGGNQVLNGCDDWLFAQAPASWRLDPQVCDCSCLQTSFVAFSLEREFVTGNEIPTIVAHSVSLDVALNVSAAVAALQFSTESS